MGNQVVFVCQQTGSTLTWTVDLPGGVSNGLLLSVTSLQVGTALNFSNDPGFGFEIHILSSSSASSIITELHVTAVRQLNNVIVECIGGDRAFTFRSTIQIALVGEPTKYQVVLSYQHSVVF